MNWTAIVDTLGYPSAGAGNAETRLRHSIVMYAAGHGAEATRLARDLRIRRVTPLDGLTRADLQVAQPEAAHQHGQPPAPGPQPTAGTSAEAPQPDPIDKDLLPGAWRAARDDGSKFELKLTAEEADLIGRHRLEGHSLRRIAAERGWYPMKAHRILREAEKRVISALLPPE